MPTFRVLRQQDAFVEYVAEVEADTAEAAVDLAYLNHRSVTWQKKGIAEYDACRVVALDRDGNEIESVKRGKF